MHMVVTAGHETKPVFRAAGAANLQALASIQYPIRVGRCRNFAIIHLGFPESRCRLIKIQHLSGCPYCMLAVAPFDWHVMIFHAGVAT